MLRPGPRPFSSLVLGLVLVTVGASATTAVTAAPPEPRPSPQQTALAWGPCDADVDPAFQCTTLAVPLDYTDPTAGTIDLALIRLPADPAVRQGAVLFNPGGPGASGYDYVADIGQVVAAWMAGLNQFDLVGFDPRGVDRSGAIDCVSDQTQDAVWFLDNTPDNEAEQFALDASDAVYPIACGDKYGDTLALYSTANAARDMDRIREALGDPQISYIGVSYGTYLGAVYATLFPERVRAMVLDSAYEPSGDTVEDQWIVGAAGFEHAFDNWAAWCEESPDCEFTAVDVGARWDALETRLDATPIQSASGRWVNQSVLQRATTASLYADWQWPMLAAALADAEAGDGTALLEIADQYNGRHEDGTYDSIFQSWRVIQCASGLGEDAPADPAAVLALLQAAAPRMSRGMTVDDFRDWCLDLIPHEIEPVVPSYDGSAPIVVVGGLNDPATPYSETQELTDMLGPSAVLVSYSGEGHGQILNSTCVTDIEAAVIASLELPAAGTTCQPFAQPSFWDQMPVPAGVGPAVDSPALAPVLGLLPADDYYTDAWALTGDPATVAAAYAAALPALGLQVAPTNTDAIEGVTAVPAFAADGTALFVMIIPPATLATEDFADLASAVPAGQGLVVVTAFASP